MSGQVKSGDRIVGVAQEGGKMIDVVGWSSSEPQYLQVVRSFVLVSNIVQFLKTLQMRLRH